MRYIIINGTLGWLGFILLLTPLVHFVTNSMILATTYGMGIGIIGALFGSIVGLLVIISRSLNENNNSRK